MPTTDTLSHRLVRVEKGIGHVTPREQLPRRHTKGPHIGLFAEAAAAERLGRHPTERHRLALHCRMGLVVTLDGKAKVGDFDEHLCRVARVEAEDEDVAAGQVAVDKPRIGEGDHAGAHLLEDRERVRESHLILMVL
eukprot:scaffold99932_cov28-Tisochrysis_lutea.AAC.3